MWIKRKLIFDLFGDSLNFGTGKVHGLRRRYHEHGNIIQHTRWYSYVMYVKWKLVSVCLDIVLVSAQDRCTVCAERSIGMEIFLGTPEGTPR
jgi:hypothetical protein